MRSREPEPLETGLGDNSMLQGDYGSLKWKLAHGETSILLEVADPVMTHALGTSRRVPFSVLDQAGPEEARHLAYALIFHANAVESYQTEETQ